MATYKELTKKVLVDTVRIANEADTWNEDTKSAPYETKIALVANSLNGDCSLAKDLVSAALEKMIAAKKKSIGYLSKEFVKATYSMITYYAAAPAEEKDPAEISATAAQESAVRITDPTSSRLKAFLDQARVGEATVVPFHIYEACDLNEYTTAAAVALATRHPLSEINIYVSPVEPNVLREKMEYYGHRPWVITPDLPMIILEKTEGVTC